MVFDYLLDDADVYAIFNHQIADLPNPQSPYKKDNPKTWGDGVLIDFGDGTLGIARKIAFDNTVEKFSRSISAGTDLTPYKGKTPIILDWGGLINTTTHWDFTLGAYNFYSPNNALICSLDCTNATGNLTTGGGSISLDTAWTNGVPSNSNIESIWVWLIFTYA